MPLNFLLAIISPIILFPYRHPKYFMMIIVLALIGFIIYLAINETKQAEKEKIDPNVRLQQCLISVNLNKDKRSKFQEYPMLAFNKNYNDNVYYFVRDYYICASNKSYLPCGVSSDIVSMDAISNVIDFGARFIDLDIYFHRPDDTFSSQQEKDLYVPSQFDKKNDIVVGLVEGGHLTKLEGTDLYQYLDFKKVCNLISQEAFRNNRSKFPLFLYLNIQFESKALEQKVYEILLKAFKTRFLPAQYGFNRFNLGEIPIIDAEGKVIIILSKKPRNPNLFELSNAVNNPKDMRFYNQILTTSQMDYGGIRTIAIEPDSDIVEKTKFNLSRINIDNSFNPSNFDTPKSDLRNLDPKECFELGFNFVCMNFQLWEDGNMEKYMEFFKNSPLVVKNDKLRYVPAPPKPLKKQTPAVDSSLRVNVIHGGFGNFDI